MDSNKMKKIMRQIEDTMAAVSFAEEGQAESAASLFKRERRVLLALKEGHTDVKTLRYALNATLRISAQLDVLFVCAPDGEGQTSPLLQAFAEELKAAGVEHRIFERSGCLKQEIIDFTNKERDVLFVVVESPGSLDADCRKKEGLLTELWKNLRCPLVVVSDAAGA
ncbi:MAG: universal stress protein [Nitrospiraceae bacterium]|nr:universal stress protein [Nitrospiraceae bacterium]